MDPDLVRIILILLGIVLVVGIYLWDRYKRATPRVQRGRRQTAPAQPIEEVEPPFVEQAEAFDEEPIARPAEPMEPKPPSKRNRTMDPEPKDLGDWAFTRENGDAQVTMDLDFDAHDNGDYLNADPALADEIERKIVVVNLVARDRPFAGAAIEKACAANDLVLGDMSIFHRHDGATGRVWFSMASMVEPGNFPGDDMSAFSTPGLSFFTQLPGVADGVKIYEEMLSVANKLAHLLNGELQDERHNKLTRQMEKHTRDAIVEHRRKIRLARSRH
jgi:cell division protein ZipA